MTLLNQWPRHRRLSARAPSLLAQHVIDESGRPLLVNKESLASIATRHLLLLHATICKHEFQQPGRKAPAHRSLGSGEIPNESFAKASDSYLSRILRLTLLAPGIVEAIISGRQPGTLQLDDLLKPLPAEWAQQYSSVFNPQLPNTSDDRAGLKRAVR